MRKKTVRDVNPRGKRVLVRVDYNVPLDEKGDVRDPYRIEASLPTVKYLVERGARVILASHLGRPKGKVVEELRLDPVAKALSRMLGRPVTKLDSCVGPEVEAAVDALPEGGVLLLENLRFYPGEEANDPEFSRQLACLADIYVNDAFGAAHRAHASTAGVAEFLPAVAGLLMEKEVNSLGALLGEPERPFVAALGGAKISDKIGVLRNLAARLDALLIGGGMANTFLHAAGRDMGDSLVELESVELARELLESYGGRIVLPVDLLLADEARAGAKTMNVKAGEVPAGWKAVDIGPESRDAFASRLEDARTAFWNGPMGVFEIPDFSAGTRRVAEAMSRCNGITVVGGGDSLAALRGLGLENAVTHASTGGGASLEFLEGKRLPGVECLEDRG